MPRRAPFDFVHDMEIVNDYLKKSQKPLAVGFERNQDHPDQVRFFDKDNKTVFLPDELYREERDVIMKSGALRKGRLESDFLKKEAERHALRLKMKRNIGKQVNNVISTVKRLFGVNQSHR